MEGGPPSFTPGLVPGVTQEHCLMELQPLATGLSPSLAPLSKGIHLTRSTILQVLQPRSHKEIGLGSGRFARRYYGHLG